MKNLTEKFQEAMSTLLFSWGGDAPSEAICTANEFMILFSQNQGDVLKELLEEELKNYEQFHISINSIRPQKFNKIFFNSFRSAMDTLLFSWGGDAPPEAVWAANELMEVYCLVQDVENDTILDEELFFTEEFLNQIEHI